MKHLKRFNEQVTDRLEIDNLRDVLLELYDLGYVEEIIMPEMDGQYEIELYNVYKKDQKDNFLSDLKLIEKFIKTILNRYRSNIEHMMVYINSKLSMKCSSTDDFGKLDDHNIESIFDKGYGDSGSSELNGTPDLEDPNDILVEFYISVEN